MSQLQDFKDKLRAVQAQLKLIGATADDSKVPWVFRGEDANAEALWAIQDQVKLTLLMIGKVAT